MEKELLKKYLNNECTKTELGEVLGWINTDALNEDGRKWIFEDWNSIQERDNIEEDSRFSIIFDKIQERIDYNSKKNNRKGNFTLTLPSINLWITRAAAVLLVPVLMVLFYTLSERKTDSEKFAKLAVDSLEVIAQMGSRTVVQLSDGSVVHLNYGSRIKYPLFFSGKTRNVVLSGEGFFKVDHNPEKPFIVKAGNLNIKAVGTTFNVLAYPDDDVIETTLINGKVILEQTILNEKSKTIRTMTPGQHVEYHQLNGTTSSSVGKVDQFISWTNGKLIFEDTPILKVAERLSRMFNVDFEIKDEIKDYIYTVTLEDESLSQILDLLTIASPVLHKIIPSKKLPDGTFSKQKIILEKRK